MMKEARKMPGMPLSLATGFEVRINDTEVPCYRRVEPRRWHHRRGYADRVNKKWKKRFGVVGFAPLIPDGTYYTAGRVLVMSSKTLNLMRRAMDCDDSNVQSRL